ncbi:hypothetical protein HO133_001934 [Letharia lupina]|uniref:Amino acid permease/ SLC12A domain-containing protein n=1 Tax=Letharia lupina TaxID=560253 RepID=A0A8H6CEY4_9LECA|nr:uncharacterized protein HO133_001934 [Letharia lupina]KAF6221966.1 hypothetical protein HO133_001934 [Letharia lupina]
MFWSKNSDAVEEMELDAELQDTHHDGNIGTQVPVEGSGVRPRGRILYTFQTHRGLKSRHIQLIALGGSIGTGLFVGTGTTLSLAGPAPLFMSFIVISAIVWIVVQSLAEMTTYLPVEGASVPFYVHRFFEPSLAFAAGWNYFYSYAMLVAAEISAASVVIDYWDNPVPVAAWITIILITVVLLNVFAVRIYGESEFWFASIKIIAILGLIILGIVLFFGGGPNHDRLGFRYWNNPGAFNSYPKPGLGNTGKFLAFWTSLIRSGFAFILSPETITIAAGESEAPRRNIPKASKRFIYRLIVFYILGTLVVSVIIASNDADLLQAVSSGTTNAGASPFVIGIKRAGIQGLDHVVNAVIITSAWSAANSFLYAGSRSLFSLAMTGQAPKVFTKCCNGVPYVAVFATAALGSLAYLSISNGSATVFAWFLNLTTIGGYVAWVVMFMTYLRFRKALAYNGILSSIPFKSPWQPYTSYFAMIMLILLCLTNGFQVFFPSNFSAASFLAAYITLPVFFALYLGHKLWARTPWIRSIETVDVWSGKEEADRQEEEDMGPSIPRNLLERIWFWIV